MKPKRVTIYTDEGTGDFSVFSAHRFFEDIGASVRSLKADDILSGALDTTQGDIFVMPGGADLPYGEKLNGAGNDAIRRFVEQGGTYFGICAGAYYGCRDIEFHKGRADEIIGERDLALIDATAYGSLPDLAGFYDDTLATATWVGLTDASGLMAQSYYHGGCAFDVRDPDAVVLARYTDQPGHPPAIITKRIGQGRAILSGVHFEARADHFSAYANHDISDQSLAVRLYDEAPSLYFSIEDLLP